jgi:prophage antirepressor-like protein
MQMSGEIMKVESKFAFEGHPVRVEMFNSEPWWSARDVAEALGYAESSLGPNLSNLVAKVPEEWRGNKVFISNHNEHEIIALSEQGVYFFLARSNMPAALPFQKWLAGEVLPSIRRTGAYGVESKKLSATQMFILQAHAYAEQERLREEQEQRARAIEAETRAVVTRVDAIEARTAVSMEKLKGIEAPGEEAREVTTRMMITRITRAYCIAHHVDYADGYKTLYREFRDRYGIDLAVRARNRNMSPIELAEHDGYLDALHAVAYRIFVVQAELEEGSDVGTLGPMVPVRREPDYD